MRKNNARSKKIPYGIYRRGGDILGIFNIFLKFEDNIVLAHRHSYSTNEPKTI